MTQKSGLFQNCPHCNGTGLEQYGTHGTSSPTCTVCNGQKIISSLTGFPPNALTIERTMLTAPVVAPSEEVKLPFNDKGEIVLPDLPQDQKDKLIEQAIETASYILLFSMKCVKVENYITGTIDNNGHTYELSFKKVAPK